ncbi:MAG TPA: MFS transporter [Gemmataceae bacterium]|nr:MFS transporter [Gemmataceae bacterium]
MGKLNDKILFWASFLTLIAAGMGASIRGDILNDWGTQFGFTQSELGTISGMALMGFGVTIIGFSFFADTLGYGKLMVVAFLLHAGAVLLTLAAPFAYRSLGRDGAYNCLYLGQLLFSFGNGTCEAVINPLTATLFPKNKTHWLNILHAGWPGGLVLGSLVSIGISSLGDIGFIARWGIPVWMLRWSIVLAPVLLYGLLMLGRSFPTSEAKEQGVKLPEMMSQVGQIGAAIAAFLIGLWFTTAIVPALAHGLGLSDWLTKSLANWLGWAAAVVLWLAFGSITRFKLGFWLLGFLYVIHAMVGYVELGTDNWIQDIGKVVLNNRIASNAAFMWTNILMFILRFFAGPIVHKISPVGLLFCSAVVGTGGLLLLGLPMMSTIPLWFVAVTIYGIGKTFYWPTMLGVISERFPRGGALALGFSGGVGMLSAGLLGAPLIGYSQDYAATRQLEKESISTYERYKSADKKETSSFLPKIAGLDNGKVGVLMNYEANKEEAKGGTPKVLDLQVDLERLRKQGRPAEELEKRLQWWETEGLPNADKDYLLVKDAQIDGGKTAFTWTAAVPAMMAVCYLILLVYFRMVGGYKAEVLIGHAADDEEFTGGTVGPGEG